MSIAGGAKLVPCVKMTLEKNENFVCVKLDFKNAFNEVNRARVVEALEEEETLQHLACHAATLLAPASGLESKGRLWGESDEGTTQGDPESGPFFNVAIHQDVRIADADLVKERGCARFGWDDGYLFGPPEVVFSTLEKFSQAVQQRCGLQLQRSKTEVYAKDPRSLENAPGDLVKAGAIIGGQWHPGQICYGVPIGTEASPTTMALTPK